MKIFVLLLISMFVMLSVSGQQENWDSYMAKYGGKPGSVLVDLGLSAIAPNKLLPYLVITGPKANNCLNPQGIPDADEINALEDILASTDNFLSGVTAKKLAGTFTYNCERLNYYYVRDTVGVRHAIARMYANTFKGYNYTLKIKHDPTWIAYQSFLYPDSNAVAWIAANKVLLTMLQAGDSLKDQRDIAHTLYFMTDTARGRFADYAKAHRYKVTNTNNAGGFALPFEITVSRYAYVKMDSIIAMENELKAVAKPLKGYYKSWDAHKNKDKVGTK